MTYNANGNISTKSDIGTTAFGYGASTGPYALTGVTSSTGVIPAVPQTISYNSFGKVSSINEANGSQTIQANFVYNSDNQRAKMTVGIYYGAEILTRYYVGGSYMKEVQPNTSNEYTYLGGDAYTAPVVVHNNRGVVSYYYLIRDYLGNITHQVNTSNTVVAEYNFDACGRRRNPTDWSYTLTGQPALFADRGFTGHEYLPWFNLYNMNGRLYDPLVGRFLNVDPYVQMPDYTQNFNRYSYCLNNPLKYTDPTGEIFGTIFGVISDLFNNIFVRTFKGDKWDWTQTKLGWEIDMGLFATDPNKSFGGRAWELISRFTWQAPQTALGYTGTGIHNLLGGVRSVDYYGGATVVESYSEGWGAITLGSYINGSRGITADPNDRLFQHEYGHYIQSQTSGWFYLSKYGILSLLSKNSTDHSLHPAEQDANIRALKYFNKNIDGYSGWRFTGINSNPIIGYNPSLSYNDLSNQAALKNGRLRLSWYDYLLGPQIILPGLLNAVILNTKY